MNDLQQYIAQHLLIDTHEHLASEENFVENGPDILQDLFAMYIGNDLISAGAPFEAVRQAIHEPDIEVEVRWNGIKTAWEVCQFTGYGEGVRLLAKLIYNMDEITLDTLQGAVAINQQLRQSGERLRLLKEKANLLHVQIDDFRWQCEPDESGADFFLYDLSWAQFCNADIDAQAIEAETGIDVRNIHTLRQAMQALFEKYGGLAIAVKAQHAYRRTLEWTRRSDADADRVLKKLLSGVPISQAERLCLGDWAWAQGAKLAAEYNLPLKIHTGYLAGNDYFAQPDHVRVAHFAPLLEAYPDTRFVLMHMAYPYSDEVLAIAKHFSNVWLDMCWGWALNPYHAADFVRRAIHSVPINKIFGFGGDTMWPTSVVAYAKQARHWLTFALQSEINDGFLTEAQAMSIAHRLMEQNQRDCFDIDATIEALQSKRSRKR